MRIVLICTLLLFSGCLKRVPPREATYKKLSEVRASMSGGVASLTVEVEERRVSRTLFRGAVSNNYLLERVRAIQLLKTDNLGDGLPEYRIFDIKEGSPYDLVGMKNADVLVGLNDYPIDEASKIPKFMYLLQGENSGLIEVRRQGKPILLKISFLD